MKFGYQIIKDRQIDFDQQDRLLYNYIQEYEPTFRLCISCGTCSSGCTGGQSNGFAPHRLFLWVRRGETDMAFKEVSKCLLCGKCVLSCPRGVNTRQIILYILQFCHQKN